MEIMPIMESLVEACDQIKTLHKKKTADYSGDNPDAHSNFKVAEYLSSLFNRPEDKGYAYMLGIKLARIATLRNKDGKPNNESIEDSQMDMACYVLIWRDRIITDNEHSKLKDFNDEQRLRLNGIRESAQG
jgi:hypothetical protein